MNKKKASLIGGEATGLRMHQRKGRFPFIHEDARDRMAVVNPPCRVRMAVPGILQCRHVIALPFMSFSKLIESDMP